tara:strand:+ start:578 stop:1240 length:663 start_codon:yes stop_codon:yes gene_type:complete
MEGESIVKSKKGKSRGLKKLEKELLWIIGFLGLLVIIFLIASSYFKSLNNFEYNGLSFQKERLGEIPIFHHFYFYKAADGGLVKYNLYLRNDPRENNVPVEGGEISFKKNSVVFIGLNATGLQQCRFGPLAVGQLASFLTDNELPVEGGSTEFWDAGASQEDWVTCDLYKGNRVIEISEGDETKITIDNKCYKITVNNCEILEAIEKFEVQSLLDTQGLE